MFYSQFYRIWSSKRQLGHRYIHPTHVELQSFLSDVTMRGCKWVNWAMSVLNHFAAVSILKVHLQTLDLCPLWTPGSDFDLLTGSIGATVTTSVSARPSWQVCHIGPLSIGTKHSWGHYISVIGRWDWSVGMTTTRVVHHCIFENIVTTLSRWAIKHWDQAGQQIHPQLRPALHTSYSSYSSNSGQDHICHVYGSILSKRLKVPFSRAVVGSRV